LQASGAGAVLRLPELRSIAVLNAFTSTYVIALSGGDVEMPLLISLSGSVGVESENPGSKIDVPSLTNFAGGLLTATAEGTVIDPNLTTLSRVGVTLDGTGTVAINQWASLTNGSVTVTGGSYSFPELTDMDGTSLDAQAGTSLTLPAVTSAA